MKKMKCILLLRTLLLLNLQVRREREINFPCFPPLIFTDFCEICPHLFWKSLPSKIQPNLIYIKNWYIFNPQSSLTSLSFIFKKSMGKNEICKITFHLEIPPHFDWVFNYDFRSTVWRLGWVCNDVFAITVLLIKVSCGQLGCDGTRGWNSHQIWIIENSPVNSYW